MTEGGMAPTYAVVATQLTALRELMDTKLTNIENRLDGLSETLVTRVEDHEKRLQRVERVAWVAGGVTLTIIIPALFVLANALLGRLLS